MTAADGVYTVPALAPGTHAVRVELAGFRPLVRAGVAIATGETVRLDVELNVGAPDEAITVIADAPLLRGQTSGLGQVVDQQKVVGLPLNGRSFITLASLAPGVALPPGSSLPRINGGRPRTNEYLFDGISVLQPEPGQVAFFPNIDAIQEFKIESNSAPAEFGRFNGGVINLTTKAGSNEFHGTAFEFFRHESLNARNYFASANPVKPAFRRNQFGGVFGGPIWRDRTFFFADYQGQRQKIDRTVISTVPTPLQRQGLFVEPIAGRVPAIYDPATTVQGPGGTKRTRFPGNAIPVERMDAVALELLARYPQPTSAGTANNYRRTDDERVDQDLFSLRLDHRLGTGRDQVFGRLTRFLEDFVPVTPLPDGSGVTSGTLGPQSTRAWSFASSYQRTFSTNAINELRVGDTRRTVRRAAAELDGPASETLGLPGIPTYARFPNTLPTFLVAGYAQLGSPPNTATEFGTSVTQIADSLTWVAGRHAIKLGADLRWSRLDVVQPPSPTGSFSFSSLFTDLPGVANTGNPLASFLLGQVQQFSIDLQQDEIRNRAHIQEYLRPGRLAALPPDHRQRWRALHAELPVGRGERPGRGLQRRDPATGVPGQDGQPRAARQLHKRNFGPRIGLVGRVADRMVARAAYRLVSIEQAGITTPFTTPVFPFLQTVSERTLDNLSPAFTLADGPEVAPIPLTPTAGLGHGVFAVDRDLGSGYVQQWNASVQRELGHNLAVEIAYVGSKITRVGIPDTNLNQLTVDQLRHRARRCCDGSPNPLLRRASHARHRWAIRRFPWRNC